MRNSRNSITWTVRGVAGLLQRCIARSNGNLFTRTCRANKGSAKEGGLHGPEINNNLRLAAGLGKKGSELFLDIVASTVRAGNLRHSLLLLNREKDHKNYFTVNANIFVGRHDSYLLLLTCRQSLHNYSIEYAV